MLAWLSSVAHGRRNTKHSADPAHFSGEMLHDCLIFTTVHHKDFAVLYTYLTNVLKGSKWEDGFEPSPGFIARVYVCVHAHAGVAWQKIQV